MKILTVDDDPGILTILEHALTSTGFHEVVSATSAMHALEQIGSAETPFECFLIDIQMPELDGIALTEIIRQTPGHGDKPILMLTAMHDTSYLDRAFRAGATDYVTKPLDIEQLRQRISSAQKTSYEKSLVAQQPFNEEHPIELDAANPEIKISHRVGIGTTDTAIDFGEFENYVLQLTRGRKKDHVLFAIKLIPVTGRKFSASGASFRAALDTAAEAIGTTLINDHGVLCYRGDGTYLCLRDGPVSASRSELENALSSHFVAASSGAAYKPQNFGFLVGDPVSLSAYTEDTVFEALSCAIGNVEDRFVLFTHERKRPSRFLFRRRLSKDQQRLERLAYKSLFEKVQAIAIDTNWQDIAVKRTKKK
ncbi:response regulator [Marimonas lutisalis]|uniref:response regulator n=1 Tax=Marimonas lutisalis TaxID=2545756 RepID=UPI0013759AA2|nr:response regulator [Marimonas lutisalis]